MRYRTIGTNAATQRSVSVLSLGAMLMGSRTDEATSFAILDRFVEAGGTFIDTSGNYAFWVHGTQGGESEELLGRWRRSRGIGDEIVIATKVGARPLAPAAGFVRSGGSLIEMDGLSAKAIRESAERSMSRLGVGRLDLMYAHISDSFVSLSETVGGGAGAGPGRCFRVAGVRGAAVLPYVPAAAGGFAFVAVAGRRARGGRSGPAELWSVHRVAPGGVLAPAERGLCAAGQAAGA